MKKGSLPSRFCTHFLRQGQHERNSLLLLAGIFLISACLLFLNLGTYSLWDDEAETALGARGILQTGDTTAVLDHNLNARRGGINLRNLHDRSTPPLASYLAAGSFLLGQQNSFFSRLPFSLLGLATVYFMLRTLREKNITFSNQVVFGIVLLTQVSFFLYFRQARYYSPSLFLFILAVYLYLKEWSSPRTRGWVGLLVALQFLAHPLICAQVCAILFFDWLIFRRKEYPFEWRWLLDVGRPLILMLGPALFVWNPFLTKSSQYLDEVQISDRLTLFYWNIRDLFTAEFIPMLTILLAPLAFLLTRNKIILRCGLALLVLTIVTSLISWQRVPYSPVADVRYIIVAIPIGIALTTTTFSSLLPRNVMGWFVIMLLVGTNLGSGKIIFEGRLNSVPLMWWRELLNPNQEPYAPVIEWVRKHVPDKASIWVEPDYMMYPLMFHAPGPTYAWQLTDSNDPQWRGLRNIHFKGRERPDYVILFGSVVAQVRPFLRQMEDANHVYVQVGQINVFWKDLYRPEIFWRSFNTISTLGQPNENIYIFQKKHEQATSSEL